MRQKEPDAVHRGDFRHGQRVLPGIDYAGSGSVQRRDRIAGDVGLQLFEPAAVNYFLALYAVLETALVQDIQCLYVVIIECKHQRAAVFVRHIQLLAQFGSHFAAFDVQACHQRAGLRVVARVDYGGVGPGGAHGDVVFLFKHKHAELVFAQREGGGCAGDAAAYDYHIVHQFSPILKAFSVFR